MRLEKSIKGEKFFFYTKVEEGKLYVRYFGKNEWKEAMLLGKKVCLMTPIEVYLNGSKISITEVTAHKQAMNYFSETLV